MRLLAVLHCMLLLALAHDAQSSEVDDADTIQRGLEFLARDAVAWKQEYDCTSCHHASLVVCAMQEARQANRKIDEPLLLELTTWLAQAGDGKFHMDRPAAAPRAASPKAIYFALALSADPTPSPAAQEGLKKILATLEDEQTAEGSWLAWPKTRPPLFGESDVSLTALATLAVLPAAASGDARATQARDHAVNWLNTAAPDDELQSTALRLVLWARLDRPQAEQEPMVRRILDSQRADGGWAQAPGLDSDAWATGQALYALTIASDPTGKVAVERGEAFLARTQRADGSWAMASRPTEPGGNGSENLVPITGAGSAWAVLGLIRSASFPAPVEQAP
ncbi:MAG: terpene cyclase/mutase family protein [Pirellulales bacterium]|nr:terpene cyclase/mutase family protein [Pirellulales bacterium]